MKKPTICQGCPFYGNGEGYLEPIHETGQLVIIGGHATQDDIRGVKYIGYDADGHALHERVEPSPFLGYKGWQLEQKGFGDISKQYILQCVPPSQPTLFNISRAVKHCNTHHRRNPSRDTRLVIAHGNLAWDFFMDQIALEKKQTLHEWRGFLTPYQKVIKQLVYGVNSLDDNAWDKVARYTSACDFTKIPLILTGRWPRDEPTNVLHITRDTKENDIDTFFNRYLREGTSPLIIDTEYTVKDKYLRLFGCGYYVESEEYYLQLYWSNSQNKGAPRNTVVKWMFDLKDNPDHEGFLFQNAAADNPILAHNWGFYGKWGFPSNYEDTMLLHAKLESELPHSLMFMESIYSRRRKKKHLSSTDELTYHLGDLSTTLDVWTGILKDITPPMLRVYNTQDKLVLPLVQWSHEQGIRVNHALVEPLYARLQEYMAHARTLSEWYCGKGAQFNINSDQQVKEWLYTRENITPILKRGTRTPTIDGEALLRLRQQYAKQYDTWDIIEGDELWNPSMLDARVYHGNCHPLLEAKSAYNYYEDKIAKYIRTHLHNKKGDKLLRVYPTISIHSQNTGRHSTTDPALAQWPDELQQLLTPDPGFMWLGGDFSGQEVWLYSCLVNDVATLEALQKGYDTHTMAMCEFFQLDYPPNCCDPYYAPENKEWREKYNILGKRDPRRDWSKSAVLALRYLKKPGLMHLVPGARALGIDSVKGLEMGLRFLELHPSIDTYRQSVIGTKPTQSETFCGRVRKLNAIGDELLRQYINSPNQGGGADMLNHTIIRACSVNPKLIHYVYGVHDSFYFNFPLKYKEEFIPQIKAAINQPYDVYGHRISIPVEWKERYCTIL